METIVSNAVVVEVYDVPEAAECFSGG